ncbi:hypothetical protein KEM55_006524 [Ascosphaera atra]|nr:hypothetical protein KEM55_006524 [Ascosphaera atra]
MASSDMETLSKKGRASSEETTMSAIDASVGRFMMSGAQPVGKRRREQLRSEERDDKSHNGDDEDNEQEQAAKTRPL